MFIFYLLCYAAVLIKFTYYAQEKELCLVYFHCLYANLHELIADSLERLFYYGVFINCRKHCYVLLDNDCSIRVYQSFVKNISCYAGIMLSAFSDPLYAQNYAGIIGWSLMEVCTVPIIITLWNSVIGHY